MVSIGEACYGGQVVPGGPGGPRWSQVVPGGLGWWCYMQFGNGNLVAARL